MSISITGATGLVAAGVVPGDTVANVTVTPSSSGLLVNGSTPLVMGVDYDTLLINSVAIAGTSFTFIPTLNGVEVTATGLASSATSFTYDIVHVNTKDEQIAALTSLASNHASNRVLCVWPPKADWDDGNGGVVTLDGTALCAAVAGAMSSYPAQQSFTNLPIAGPQKLYYSNTYFTPVQLNQLSSAGVFVLVQDTPGANIYSRHQVTTDTSALDKQEFSVTKAIDKVSLDLYNLVKPYIGKYNITQNLLTQLTDLLDQYLFTAQNTSAPYCGSLILSSANLKIAAQLNGQNLTIPLGTVDISLTVEVGFPANYINITLNVN